MSKADERMKKTSEALSGIKYIKMSGWENSFLEKVCSSREEELKYLKMQFSITCWQNASAWAGSTIVTATVLGSYVFLNGAISAQQVFGIVSVFLILGVNCVGY
jgi:ABC-type multidrug transport system, ATPase and permease components